MHPRVTAVLVARDGEPYLRRTIDAINAQTRRPDLLIAVDAASSDASADLLATSGAAQLIRLEGKPTFGAAVRHAVHLAEPPQSDDEWLWLLAHDNAPEPGALAALLASVEVAPSVAVAGPKLMRSDAPDVIAQYGETLTITGASVQLVRDELDQGQHDTRTDVLAVAAGGMLVRRTVWDALAGFDPALPSIGAALDFCVRARLAGHRVSAVPDARVLSAGSAALFGRRARSGVARQRIRRAAQLHRRLVYAPAAMLPLHWLSLLPLAVLRSLWHIVAKRPELIPGEFATALTAAFAARRVMAARRNLRRRRTVGWAAIAPLRMPPLQVRELRAHERDVHDRERLERAAEAGAAPATPAALAAAEQEDPREHPDFFSGGGAWVTLIAIIAAAVAFGGFAGSAAVVGGGLVPLAATPGELWHTALSGWREIGSGFAGAADPFALLVALLGSITFWAPSLSVVGLYLIALPLAAVGAWIATARWSHRSWGPNLAAIAWAFAPPFLASLNDGRLGAVIAHLLLPWLVYAATLAVRSWPAAASTALLAAAIIAAAPVLAPALVVAWLVSMAARPRAIHRLLLVPVPAIVLFLPLAFEQLRRGTPLALLADPGVPALGGTASGWHLALGAADTGLHGWSAISAALGFGATLAPAVLVTVLVAPLAVLAVLAVFLRGTRKALFALALALLGYVTAVLSAHLEVTAVGATTTPIWPAAGLSLFWLGLVLAAASTLESIRRAVPVVTVVASVALLVLAAPAIAAPALGAAGVRAGDGRMLPAYVTAEAGRDPQLGTIVLTPTSDGAFTAQLQRGAGTTLEAQSTLAATRHEPDAAAREFAELAANLVVPSGFDIADVFERRKLGFVVLSTATAAAAASETASPETAAADSTAAREARRLAAQSLDRNGAFVAVGQTDSGLLWRYTDPTERALAQPDSGRGAGVWAVSLAVVFGLTLLLAAPTGRRLRRIRRTDAHEPTLLDELDETDEVLDGRA